MLYLRYKKSNRPQGVDLVRKVIIEYHPNSPKLKRVVFSMLEKHYLINVKTNVSNAKMNMPKAIRSLKSK